MSIFVLSGGGAMATEEVSAHDNAPTRNELENRIKYHSPDEYPLKELARAA